jgi:adenosylcobyric acid synthase
MSNFTDFNALERDSRVHLYYTNEPAQIDEADIVILPGTKSTLHDLQILRRDGIAQAVIQAHKKGKTILGICGGYQMLGRELVDPDGIESGLRQLPGLNLLPLLTTLEGDKITRQVNFTFAGGNSMGSGYEIHNGRTEILSEIKPMNHMEDGSWDGCFTGKCFGTYIHGILDNAEFIDFLVTPYLTEKERRPSFDYFTFKEEQYNRLADHVRRHVDLPLIYSMIREGVESVSERKSVDLPLT